MKVKDLMQSDIAVCETGDSLNKAAQLMWERDCGVIPVLNLDSGEFCGVVTDRDICMAGYTRGQPLSQIRIPDVMNVAIASCAPDDDLSAVHEAMREHRVRRVPVIDDHDRLAGIVSLNDLALHAAETKGKALQEVALTLAKVCEHRSQPATR